MPCRSAITSQPAIFTRAVRKNGISGASPSTTSVKICSALGPSMPKRKLVRPSGPPGFCAVWRSRVTATSYPPVSALNVTQSCSCMPLMSSKVSSPR